MVKKLSFEEEIAKQCRWECRRTRRKKLGNRAMGRTTKSCYKNCVKYFETHSFIPYWRRRRRRK